MTKFNLTLSNWIFNVNGVVLFTFTRQCLLQNRNSFKEHLLIKELPSSNVSPVYNFNVWFKPPSMYAAGKCPTIYLLCQARCNQHLSIYQYLSIYLQKQLDRTVGQKSSLQHLCNFCAHPLTIFSILLPQTIRVSPYPQSPTSLCGYYWPSWPFLPLINK